MPDSQFSDFRSQLSDFRLVLVFLSSFDGRREDLLKFTAIFDQGTSLLFGDVVAVAYEV